MLAIVRVMRRLHILLSEHPKGSWLPATSYLQNTSAVSFSVLQEVQTTKGTFLQNFQKVFLLATSRAKMKCKRLDIQNGQCQYCIVQRERASAFTSQSRPVSPTANFAAKDSSDAMPMIRRLTTAAYQSCKFWHTQKCIYQISARNVRRIGTEGCSAGNHHVKSRAQGGTTDVAERVEVLGRGNGWHGGGGGEDYGRRGG